MALTRPCPDSGDLAAAALYLASLATDLEFEFSRLATALASTGVTAAVVQRVTANYNTFATLTVGQDIFLTNTTTDIYISPGSDQVDGSGLWLYGFSVQCNPSGADTLGSARNLALTAGYTDAFGEFVSFGTVQDTVFEVGDVPINRLNSASSFVVPAGLGVFVPDFPSSFTHGNVASQITILAGTMMWALRITPDAQIATVE